LPHFFVEPLHYTKLVVKRRIDFTVTLLFSDTSAGAHANTVIYSFIETAKINLKEPQA